MNQGHTAVARGAVSEGRQETVAALLTRLHPEPGDILLFHHAERFRSRVISWFTRSPFYHVGIYAGNGQVIEARMPQVMRRDLFTQKDGFRFLVVHAPERETAKRALAWAEQQIGATYDMENVLRLTLARLFHWGALCQCAREDRFVCGNFVVRAYAAAGIDLFPGRDAAEIVPADFRTLLHRPIWRRNPLSPQTAGTVGALAKRSMSSAREEVPA